MSSLPNSLDCKKLDFLHAQLAARYLSEQEETESVLERL